MEKKLNIPLVLVVVLVFGSLLGIIFLTQTQVSVHQPSVNTPSASEVSGSQLLSSEAPAGGRAGGTGDSVLGSSLYDSMIASPASSAAVSERAGKDSLPASSLSDSALAGRASGLEGEQEPPVPVNAPMSDEKIMEQGRQYEQAALALQKNNAVRDQQAARVMHDIATGVNQPPNTDEVIPSDSPRWEPPPDIVQKIKSHQLVAH